MINENTNLEAFATELEQQAKDLAADANKPQAPSTAAHVAEPEIALDPDFVEHLDQSLAAPLGRLQAIATGNRRRGAIQPRAEAL